VSDFVQIPLGHQTYINRCQNFSEKGQTAVTVRSLSPDGAPLTEGSPMFTAEQYRAKASEYAKLVGTASDANERREFQRLERSFSELADNAQWMIENRDKTVTPEQGAAQR
jgi:hypothetical protein